MRMRKEGIQLQRLFCLHLLLSMFVAEFLSSTTAFLIQKSSSQHSLIRSITSRHMLEVEQKFVLTDNADVEEKLRALGFIPKRTIKFVDWYFDTHDVSLTTRDIWLRYRESGGEGAWQLKQGRGEHGSTEATVYKETEGPEAVTTAVSFLSKDVKGLNAAEVTTFEGHTIPKLPEGNSFGLLPFCRIETTRSSWKEDSHKSGLSLSNVVVDLDKTNTNFAVGEVEVLVESDTEISDAKKKIQSFIDKIVDNSIGKDDEPAIGKVEHFLINHRPEHYEACVASGTIKKIKG